MPRPAAGGWGETSTERLWDGTREALFLSGPGRQRAVAGVWGQPAPCGSEPGHARAGGPGLRIVTLCPNSDCVRVRPREPEAQAGPSAVWEPLGRLCGAGGKRRRGLLGILTRVRTLEASRSRPPGGPGKESCGPGPAVSPSGSERAKLRP